MKRKLYCILIALMLTLPALALAEAEPSYAAYAHPDGSYAFQYPDTWLLLSRDTINELLAAVDSEDEQFQTLLEGMRPQLEQTDMVLVMTRDFSTNINIAKQTLGMALNGEMLQLLSASTIEQLRASLPSIVFPEEPQLTEINERSALTLSYTYTLSGSSLAGVQVYLSVGETLYVVTLTCAEDKLPEFADTLNAVLESMSFN